MLKCFAKINKDVEIAIKRLKYKETDTYKYNMNKNFTSFEKYCKAVSSKAIPKKYKGSIPTDKFNIPNEDCKRLIKSLPLRFILDDEPKKM
jgi:hypothetical protein